MTDELQTALPDDLRDLLGAERDRPDLPEVTVDLAWRHLAASLDPGPGGGEGQASDGSQGHGSARDGNGSGAASQGLSSIFGVKTTLVSLLIGTVLGFGAGHTLGTGAVADAPSPATLRVAGAIDEPSPHGTVISVDDLPGTAPPRPAASATAAPAASPPPSATAGVQSTLKQERLLLERARAALLHDDPDEALAALAAHRTAFPNGQLASEREALAQQAKELKGAVDASP
jgi:hypothetical protein